MFSSVSSKSLAEIPPSKCRIWSKSFCHSPNHQRKVRPRRFDNLKRRCIHNVKLFLVCRIGIFKRTGRTNMGQDSQGFRQKREEADEWKVNKKKVIQTIYIYILIMPSRRKKRKRHKNCSCKYIYTISSQFALWQDCCTR